MRHWESTSWPPASTHADAYLRVLAEHGDPRTGRTLAAASIARRTFALHGFYRYAPDAKRSPAPRSPQSNAPPPTMSP
ncbi:protein of unknown function [Modestobacter italicus]|uniref:Uncharacterized protein n=1 Tax=Modestobacter italicus (strain DSM 44449 / CECT 9708 / BC 501) TaxID=2732864 RepID=I4F0W8_MODI5|nr:hypothetical protein [Modestobacter marinus]CCH89281.1 protein of unknown function [Modestobacter marinus]